MMMPHHTHPPATSMWMLLLVGAHGAALAGAQHVLGGSSGSGAAVSAAAAAYDDGCGCFAFVPESAGGPGECVMYTKFLVPWAHWEEYGECGWGRLIWVVLVQGGIMGLLFMPLIQGNKLLQQVSGDKKRSQEEKQQDHAHHDKHVEQAERIKLSDSAAAAGAPTRTVRDMTAAVAHMSEVSVSSVAVVMFCLQLGSGLLNAFGIIRRFIAMPERDPAAAYNLSTIALGWLEMMLLSFCLGAALEQIYNVPKQGMRVSYTVATIKSAEKAMAGLSFSAFVVLPNVKPAVARTLAIVLDRGEHAPSVGTKCVHLLLVAPFVASVALGAIYAKASQLSFVDQEPSGCVSI